MVWGTHGVKGKRKSPRGMMALASLLLLICGHLGLEVLAKILGYDGFSCLFPFDLRSSGLGGAIYDTFCLQAV